MSIRRGSLLFTCAAAASFLLLLAVCTMRVLETRIGRWLGLPMSPSLVAERSDGLRFHVQGGGKGYLLVYAHRGNAYVQPTDYWLVEAYAGPTPDGWLVGIFLPYRRVIPALSVLPLLWLLLRWRRRRQAKPRPGFAVSQE